MKRIFLVAALGLGLAAFPSSSFAQSDDDKSAARALGQEGQDALDKKDFPTARDRFRRAVKIFDDAKAPVPPTLLLGLARSSAGTGSVIQSQEAYNRVIRQGTPPGAPQIFVQAVEDAKKEIDAVSARIASVRITVSGCDSPSVTIDDNPMSSAMIGVNKPVDPGTHVVKATAAGCKPGETSFTVTDGKSADAPIKLEKDTSGATTPPAGGGTTTPPAGGGTTTPPAGGGTTTPAGGDTGASSGSPNKALAITGFAVGGVGIVLGAITGIVAIGQHSSLANDCPGGTCPANKQSDLDGYHTMGLLSTIGFIAGGVGLAAGIVFLVTAPKDEQKKSAWIAPTIGPGTIGAVGQF